MITLIVTCVILWIALGAFGAATFDEDGTHYSIIAFFWPVTLPVLFVFGAAYALFITFKECVGWFKE